MDTCHKKKIDFYFRLYNRTWLIHFFLLDTEYYERWICYHAYKDVFLEMCKLFSVEFIAHHYETLFFNGVDKLEQYHSYINSWWNIIKNVKHIQDDKLINLRLKMANLVIEQYTFVSVTINKEYCHH
jgi:hypothetical protein